MRRALAALVAVGAVTIVDGAARGDGWRRLPEGAALYAVAQPATLIAAAQRLGVDRLPAMQRIKRQLGGIDPFNPILLAAPGLDVNAPLVASAYEPLAGLGQRARLVATVRDKPTFDTFLLGLIASGKLPLKPPPAGMAGVLAVGSPSPTQTLLLRLDGEQAILDLVEAGEGKKAPSPAELARRLPLTPPRSFAPGAGARRLLTPTAAAAVYIDARKLLPLGQQLRRERSQRELGQLTGHERSQLAAKQRLRDKKCAALERSPTVFDDAALALTVTPDALSLLWAWGTQSGPPLGGLKLVASDDGLIDLDAAGRDAALSFALYAASVQPYAALKRSGVYGSGETAVDAIEACGDEGSTLMLLRSWPLLLAATLATPPDPSSPFTLFKQSLGTLRNLVTLVRSFDGPEGARGVIAASFDGGARASLELMLAALGGQAGAATPFGSHSATPYTLNVPGASHPLILGLETLPGSRVGLTVAESQETLGWAYKAHASTPAGPPPLARLSVDLPQLRKAAPKLRFDADEQQLVDLLLSLKHVDGTMAADGDLLSITLRAPLKP